MANDLVLVTHSIVEDLKRLEEMKIKLPHNVLVIDLVVLESAFFRAGLRGAQVDARTGKPRQQSSTLSLRSIVHSLGVAPDYPLHNAGNDAFAALLATQLLLDPKNTRIPVTPHRTRPPMVRAHSHTLYGPAPASPVPFLSGPGGATPGGPPVMPAAIESRAHSTSPRMLAVPSPRPGSRPHSAMFPSIGPGRSGSSLTVPADEDGRLTSRRRSVSSSNALQTQMARATIG